MSSVHVLGTCDDMICCSWPSDEYTYCSTVFLGAAGGAADTNARLSSMSLVVIEDLDIAEALQKKINTCTSTMYYVFKVTKGECKMLELS